MLIRFLHLLGVGIWLGGGLAALVAAYALQDEGPDARAAVDRLLGKLYAWVIAPGTILAVGAGIALTMMLATAGDGESLGDPAIAAMQGLGLVAGGLELLVSFPGAQQLSQVVTASEAGGESPSAARLRRRVARVTTVTMTLVVISLIASIA